MKTLTDMLNQRNLSALFQPIADLSDGTFYGFEGLIRGPADSPLHLPVNLFAAARQQKLSLETEMLSRQIVLESFAAQKLPGKLFLNVSPDTLTHHSFKNVQTLAYLEYLGIDPKRIIIEVTENQPVCDFEKTRNAMLHFRSLGYRIAIDDLGEGFSSLRLWSELRPEFIKVDMHFVRGINADPLKQQFLRSIQNIAQSSGSQVIAEGVETDDEFRFVRDIGIAFGQGNFIARPHPTPPLNAAAEISCLVKTSHTAERIHCRTSSVTAEKVLRYVEPVHPETEIEKLFAYFSGNGGVRAIPVVKQGCPVGLINRYEFVDNFAQPLHRKQPGKKLCSSLMNTNPLLVEKSTPLHELSSFLSVSDIQHFTDGFIITEQGRYIGLGCGQDLLREITKAQIENARYANPLTLLPGNVPVNEHIDYLLRGKKTFTVCHADIDHFKPFNNVFGYRKGDEAIQFTARLLGWACDQNLDFIGHIGGDDFILIMQSADWEKRCNRALTSFAQTSAVLFEEEHRPVGGYFSEDRLGRLVHHHLPTLSIGAIRITPGMFRSHHEVSEAASAARKMAKKKSGNSLFVERRELREFEQHEIANVYY